MCPLKQFLLLRAYAIAVAFLYGREAIMEARESERERERKDSPNWLESNFVFSANIFLALHLTLHNKSSSHCSLIFTLDGSGRREREKKNL
jgi:hypothetical protein